MENLFAGKREGFISEEESASQLTSIRKGIITLLGGLDLTAKLSTNSIADALEEARRALDDTTSLRRPVALHNAGYWANILLLDGCSTQLRLELAQAGSPFQDVPTLLPVMRIPFDSIQNDHGQSAASIVSAHDSLRAVSWLLFGNDEYMTWWRMKLADVQSQA